MMRETIQDRARGRWQDILAAIGFNPVFLTGKNGPCPFCGGKDRWRFEDKEGSGSWICNHCSTGRRQSGVDLVMKLKSVNFIGAKQIIEEHIGEAKVVVPKASQSDEKRREDMRALWLSGRLLDGSDVASRYLIARGLKMAQWPSALRYVNHLPHRDDSGKRTVWPAMIAKFSAGDCRSSTLHRTWLTEPGEKAPVVPVRKFMPGPIPVGAVRLGEPAETMGVAEGICTALAASKLFGIPVWAATGTAQLARWQPPPEAKHVIICADNDKNFAGQSAAYALAHRLSVEGRDIEIRMPALNGDFNDALNYGVPYV